MGKWHPVGLPCPVPLQRSHFELLALDLPGPAGISPVQSSAIRFQDNPPCLLPISASFRDPSGSLTISMRLRCLNEQGPNTWFASVPFNAQATSFTASRVMAGRVPTSIASSKEPARECRRSGVGRLSRDPARHPARRCTRKSPSDPGRSRFPNQWSLVLTKS